MIVLLRVSIAVLQAAIMAVRPSIVLLCVAISVLRAAIVAV